MIRRIFGGFAILLMLVPTWVSAQDEAPQTAFVYATYYTCDPAMETRADEIIQRTYATHYDAAVEAGNIASWSWLAHFVGGQWRRVLVLTALDMEHLLESSGALGEIIEESTPEAGRVFSEVCGEHVDYIWQISSDIGTITPGQNRGGSAGFSAYMVCDMSREERADEIMQETFGPIYDNYIESGDISSWGWLEHVVGGEYRRLLTMTAADHQTMMAVREKIVGDLRSRRNERAFNQFSEICHSHRDYMWDIQVENP